MKHPVQSSTHSLAERARIIKHGQVLNLTAHDKPAIIKAHLHRK